MLKICSDTIDAASGEYAEAINGGKIDSLVEYHDSRGYLTAAGREVDQLQSRASGEDKNLIRRFQMVLEKAQWIVEPLIPSEKPRASLSEYRAVAAEAAALTHP